jgi:hypothetical protein
MTKKQLESAYSSLLYKAAKMRMQLQTLNAELRRKFFATLGDIVADHENY